MKKAICYIASLLLLFAIFSSSVISSDAYCDNKFTVTASNVAETGKIKLSWSAVDNAQQYVVYRSTKKDGSFTKLYTTKSTSFVNSSTTVGKRYYYKVKAICDSGNVSSSVVYRVCDCARVSEIKTLWNSKGKVVFKWDKVSGADYYKILRSSSKTGSYKQIAKTENLKFTDSDAAAGKTYYYKFIACSSLTSSANSAAKLISATATYPSPKNLQNISTNYATAIKWDSVDGVDGYLVYRGKEKNIDEMVYVKTVKRNRMTDDGVYKGKYYAVAAYKELSNGKTLISKPAYIYIK